MGGINTIRKNKINKLITTLNNIRVNKTYSYIIQREADELIYYLEKCHTNNNCSDELIKQCEDFLNEHGLENTDSFRLVANNDI